MYSFVSHLKAIFLILFLFGLSGIAGAEPAATEVGKSTLQTPSSAESYFGSGTTHTTKLKYDDDGSSYARPVEIESLARALRNDADLIYEFVRNRIEIVPVYGLQKGALGAYIDRAGTAFDHAHLMVELLREAGYTAKYKQGTITLNQTQFDDWLGFSDAKAACQMLADGGIPATVNSATDCSTLSGNVSTVVIAHIWVEATISSTAYVFDPAYKTHTTKAGINLATAMDYTTSNFYTSASTGIGSGTEGGVSYVKDINAANIVTKLDTYADNLLEDLQDNHFVADLDDIIGGSDVDQEVLPAGGLRQTSLPYTSSTSATWTGDIPDQYRTTLQVELGIAGESDTIDVEFYVDEIYGRKLELAPDLSAGDWASPQSGNFEVALQVDERTVRQDNGTTPAVFTSTQAANARAGFDLDLTVDHTYAASSGAYMDRTVSRVIDLNTHATIVHGWGYSGPAMLAKLDDEFGADAAVATGGSSQNNTKAKVGASLLAQFSKMAYINARLGDGLVQHHHSLGVIFSQTEVDVSGTDYIIVDQSVHIDLATGISVNSETSVAADRDAVIHGVLAASNALEGSVMEQMLDTPDAASTAERFEWAEANLTSAKYFLFTPGDESGTTVDDLMLVEGNASCLSGCSSPFYINHATTVHDDIKSYLTAGYNVLAVNDAFIGPGWELGYADTGSSRYATLQRGGAFIAFKDDLSKIGHITPSWQGSYTGGGAALSANHEADYYPELAADVQRARFEGATPTGANIMNGRTGFSTGDVLSVGSQPFPYSLSVGFSYDEYTGDFQHGWHQTITSSGSGMELLGENHHLRAVASIVAYYVTQDMHKADPGELDHIIMIPFIQHWWRAEAANNVVSFQAGISGSQFVKLIDGTFDPTVGSLVTLAQTNSRSAERKNEGTTTVTDPGNLYQNYDYGTVDYTITLADTTKLEFKNFTYVPGGSTSANAVKDTQFRVEDMDFPSGHNVSLTYAGGTDSLPYVDLVANDTDHELDFIGADTLDSYSIDRNIGGGVVDILDGTIQLSEGEEIKVETGGLSTAALARPTIRTTVHKVTTPGRPDDTIPTVEYSYDDANFVITSQDSISIDDEAESASNPRGDYEYFTVAGHRAEMKNPLDEETTIYLDFDGNLAEAIDGLGRVTTFTYDALGRVTEQEAPEGNKVQFVYNDDHQLTSTTQVPKSGSGLSDRTASITWNTTYNKPATMTDFRSEVTTYTYGTTGGATGQVTELKLPDLGVTEVKWIFTYDLNGQLTNVENPLGIDTDLNYNSSGDLININIDPGSLDIKTYFNYNSIGNMTWVIDPRGANAASTTYRTTFTYDSNRRRTNTTLPEGDESDNIFNPLGQLTKVEQPVDTLVEITAFNTSLTGRRIKVTSPDGAEVTYTNDDLDRVETIADPELRKVKYFYDAAGQVTKQIRAFGSTIEIDYAIYTYNDNGTLDSVKDAEGNLTEYFYDGFDRLEKVQYPSKTTAGQSSTTDKEEYTWDASDNLLTRKTRKGDTITFVYDEHNRVTSKTPGTQTAVVTTYDKAGQVTEVKYADNSYKIEFTYDDAGRTSTSKDITGGYTRTITYTYDKAGNMTKIKHNTGVETLYEYDENSRLTLVEKSNGVDLAVFTYDDLSRLSTAKLGINVNTPLATYSYEIDGALDTIDHDLKNTGNDVKLYYDYDKSNRLTSRVFTQWTYVYNPVGADVDEDYTVNGLNQVDTVTIDTIESTITYDAGGNLTGDGTWTYTYDVENRLTQASDGTTTVDYKYDPLNRRYEQKVGSAVTQYLSSGSQEILELNGSNVIQKRYIFGQGIDRPIMYYDGSGTAGSDMRFYRADHQGTIIATTDKDGLLQEKHKYDEYGLPKVSTGQPIRYTGRRWDANTGLYYYRARYYSPTLGRFLQTDPIGYGDGLNMYAYVGNDPMNNRDPSGLADQVTCPPTNPQCDDPDAIEEVVVTGDPPPPPPPPPSSAFSSTSAFDGSIHQQNLITSRSMQWLVGFINSFMEGPDDSDVKNSQNAGEIEEVVVTASSSAGIDLSVEIFLGSGNFINYQGLADAIRTETDRQIACANNGVVQTVAASGAALIVAGFVTSPKKFVMQSPSGGASLRASFLRTKISGGTVSATFKSPWARKLAKSLTGTVSRVGATARATPAIGTIIILADGGIIANCIFNE